MTNEEFATGLNEVKNEYNDAVVELKNAIRAYEKAMHKVHSKYKMLYFNASSDMTSIEPSSLIASGELSGLLRKAEYDSMNTLAHVVDNF